MIASAVIFGAGSIGRGFIGPLLAESGYSVTFVDIDEPLIRALNERGAYTLSLVENDNRRDVTVGPVRGVLSDDVDAVTEALAAATVGATAVGARALQHIAPLIAAGIERRREEGIETPLNIIVCENLPNAADILRALIESNLPPADADGRVDQGGPVDEISVDYAGAHLGLVNAVIGRMVPEPTAEMRARDVSAIVTEPFFELPVDRAGFRGDPPRINGLLAVAPFAPWAARKLYLHNAAHAVMAYVGYRRGCEMGYETLADPIVRGILDQALAEAQAGLLATYGAAAGWDAGTLREHVAQLLPRLGNRALADPVRRLARDPLRKLAPGDRLVGAARLAEIAGVEPEGLAWGIAAALVYDAAEDPAAEELQVRIEDEGVAKVLESVCGIVPDEPLGVSVVDRYNHLLRGEWMA